MTRPDRLSEGSGVTVRPKVARSETRPGRPWAADVRSFVRGSVPLFLSLGLLNASNYAFHVVASRLLGPSQYGALAALLAFVLVVSVPSGVLQTVAAKRVAGLNDATTEDEYRSLTTSATRGVEPFAVLAGLAIMVAAPLIASFLHVGVLTALLLGPYVLFALVSSVLLGVLQGRMRFGRVGCAQATAVVVRFGAGVSLVLLGLGVAGALLGSVLAQGAVLLVAARLNALRWGDRRRVAPTTKWFRGHTMSTLAALSSFWLLVETDLVLARHFLPSATSGVYSAAGVLARAILFLPAAISIVALPHFARVRDRPGEARRWLTIALVLTGPLAVATLVLMIAFRTTLLSITFGPRFVDGAPLMPVLGLAMVALALTNVLIYFHVAMETRAYRLVFVAIGIEIAVVVFFHDDSMEVATAMLCVSWLVAIVLHHAARAADRWRPAASSRTDEQGATTAGTPQLSIVLPCRNTEASLAPADVLVLERRPGEPSVGTGETRPERRPAASEPESAPAPQVDAARLVN